MKHLNENINEALRDFTIQIADNQTRDSEYIFINAESKMVHYFTKEQIIEKYGVYQDALLRRLLSLKPGNFYSQKDFIWIKLK